MVLLQLLGLCLQVVIPLANYILETNRKSSNSRSTSQRSAESLIREMEPRITDIKNLNEKMGRPREGNELIEKLEEGKMLVRNRPKDYQKKLEKWEHSFRGLPSAVTPVELARDVKEIAFNTREIADNLKQIKELLLNKQRQSPSATHLQLDFSVKDYNAVILNYKHCRERVNKSLRSTSINQTKNEKEKDQREKLKQRNTETGKTSGSHSNIMHSKQVGETSMPFRSVHPQSRGPLIIKSQKVLTIIQSTCTQSLMRVLKFFRCIMKNPENNTVVLRKVVLAVLARDEAGKKIIEETGRYVRGVISANRDVKHNQDQDVVTVKSTKDLVLQDIIEYLKEKLHQKNVYFISNTPWEEQ